MKKHSALMRASGILLVLTLGTSCFVGGTFAKYVTRADATDTARVAKWGVEVTVTGDAFKTQYNKDTTEDAPGITVSSGEKVVAPGTFGTFGGVAISGTPEVAVKVTTDTDFELGENWTDDEGAYYCPIVIDVNNVQFCGLNYTTVAEFETAVEDAIDAYISGNYDAGTDLSQKKNLNSEIKWRWAFDENSLDSVPSGSFGFTEPTKANLAAQTDENDTFLGDKAAGGTAPTISITVTTTVTQID